jgi:hypothetical protein
MRFTRAERFGISLCIFWAVAVTTAAVCGVFDAQMPLASAVVGHAVTEFDRYSLIRYLRAMLAPILGYWIVHLGVVLVWRRK